MQLPQYQQPGMVNQNAGEQPQLSQVTFQPGLPLNSSQSPPAPSAAFATAMHPTSAPSNPFQPQQATAQQQQLFSQFQLPNLEIQNPLNHNPNQLSILNNLAGFQQQQ